MEQAVRSFGGDSAQAPTPVRTCTGCRRRDAQSALLRVVAAVSPEGPGRGWVVEPDPGRRRPGRGAYVHPDADCLQLAIQRKAFGRALRRDGRPDVAAVEAWVEAQQ